MTLKHYSFVVVMPLLLAVPFSTVWAGFGMGVAGSKHDFSVMPWNPPKELCRVCHVPHDHLRTRYQNGLLWNHALSSATYTMYGNAWSSTLSGTQSPQPDGVSKLCLGCHDGTVGVDSFDSYAGGSVSITDINATMKVPAFVDGGNRDMRGTHPISIGFPASEIGTEFNDPSNTNWSTGGSVASTLEITDGSAKVQCSTCHDVHDQEAVPGTRLLRSPQTVAEGGQASGLCLTCHIK